MQFIFLVHLNLLSLAKHNYLVFIYNIATQLKLTLSIKKEMKTIEKKKKEAGMHTINASHLSRAKRDSSRIVWTITRFIIAQSDCQFHLRTLCYYRNTLCTRTTAAADWSRYVFSSAGQSRGDKATERYVHVCVYVYLYCASIQLGTCR